MFREVPECSMFRLLLTPVEYCSRVTEHGVMKIPFSLQLTSLSLTSDANLKPVY